MAICGVSLIRHRCGGPTSTPHSSGFRGPCIWPFLSNLGKMTFLAACWIEKVKIKTKIGLMTNEGEKISLDLPSSLVQNFIELQERLRAIPAGRRRGKSLDFRDETLRQKDCNLLKSWKDLTS